MYQIWTPSDKTFWVRACHKCNLKFFLFLFKKPIEEVEKLAKFLEVKAERNLVEDIVDKCDFSKMKKEKDPMEVKAEWRDGQPGMYRKGDVFTSIII